MKAYSTFVIRKATSQVKIENLDTDVLREPEELFRVMVLSHDWTFIPDIMTLRHRCGPEGTFKSAAVGTRRDFICENCRVEMPAHLGFVLRVWAE